MTPTRYRTYLGNRIHRWRTYPNRWGGGAVHLRVYVRGAKEWRFACPISFTHGEEITDRDVVAPVTCKRCLTSGSVPPDWRPTDTPTEHPPEREVKKIKEKKIMALRGASSTVIDPDQADWISWDDLVTDNAAVVCTVLSIEDKTDLGNGPLRPVRARIVVLTGPRAGTVYEDERVLKAGIRNKLTKVGDDICGRVARYGPRKAIGLEAEKAGDIELAKQALAKLDGSSPEAPARGKAKAKTVETDDSEPPF